MLSFDNVGLRYGMGPEVLRDLSFTVGSGSFWKGMVDWIDGKDQATVLEDIQAGYNN